MYVLGMNVGHNATACLLKDGRIMSCVSEERFTRIKNFCGVPLKSIKFVLEDNSITIKDIDLVVTDDYYPIYTDPYYGKRYLEAYTNKSLKKKIFSKAGYLFPGAFSKYLNLKSVYYQMKKNSIDSDFKINLGKMINVSPDKIERINHHLAHALSPCFNLPKNEKTLIFTSDGEGSGLSGSISIFDGKELKVISKTGKADSIGCLYAIATIYLGMKPLEHEFKVMGMAPYAKSYHVDKIYSKLRRLFWIDEHLVIHSKFNIPFIDYFFEKEMKFVRFDTFAGAVQKLVEDIKTEWVRKAINKTGIHSLALSGGTFMNVKANQKIAELEEVKKLFVMPSSGDESNAMGCCYYGYKQICERNKLLWNPEPLKHLYLGPYYNDEYVESLIKERNLRKKYEITYSKNIARAVGQLLAKGEIVARCSGRSEWGARALGNRSILANPSHPDTIRVLNEMIKDRDFWMPFTPSVMAEEQKKYFLNPKEIPCPYMVITFNGTESAKKDMPAAMHPYDHTVRPQAVYKEWNPEYYAILSEFRKITGVGALLNTSFNLHGEPNVLTPEDAFHTLENSALKYLALGNYLFRKKSSR